MAHSRSLWAAAIVGLTLGVSAEAQGDAASPLRWILQSSQGSEGETFGAWLVATNASPPLNVSVDSPFAATIVGVHSAECSSAQTSPRPWKGQLTTGQIAYFCVTPHQPGSLRLLATVEIANSSPAAVTVAVSDSYLVKAWYDFGEVPKAVLTTLLGLVVGLIAYFFQQLISAYFADRTERRNLEAQVRDGLMKEMDRNREMLFAYLTSAAKAEKAQTGAYNNMSKPLKEFLFGGQRGRYFKEVQDLYNRLIPAYNDGIDNNASDLRQRAQTALTAMEKVT
jgi:hypothetical protein